ACCPYLAGDQPGMTRRPAKIAFANRSARDSPPQAKVQWTPPSGERTSMDGEFTRIINALPGLIWTARPDGYVECFNQHYLDYVGLSAKQIEGWGWRVVIHPDDLKDLEAHWRNNIATGKPGDCEARIRRSDGTYRWFLFRANPLRDDSGKIVEWYGI